MRDSCPRSRLLHLVYRLPLAVNAQKTGLHRAGGGINWCLQHASVVSERWCGWWGAIKCRLPLYPLAYFPNVTGEGSTATLRHHYTAT